MQTEKGYLDEVRKMHQKCIDMFLEIKENHMKHIDLRLSNLEKGTEEILQLLKKQDFDK